MQWKAIPIPHDKSCSLLAQWFCISHNSMFPVLPSIWDPPAPKAETQLVLWFISPYLQSVVPILNCVTINNREQKEMPYQQALVSTSNSDKPAGVKPSLSRRLSFS